MKRTISAALFSLVALCGLWAVPEQKIVYAMPSEAETLDPSLNNFAQASIVLQNLFAGLYRMDKSGKPVPALASGFTLDSTKTVYTFTIKSTAKWSDGKPVTAQDFEYAWRRVLDPKTASRASSYLYCIKNAQAVNEGKADVSTLGVQALDTRTLRVTLENPIPYFLSLLFVSPFDPVRRDIVEGNPNWTKDPKTYVSTGPFMLAEIRPKEKYVLKKNPYYVDAANVKLDTIEIVFIEAEESRLAAYLNNEIQVYDDPGLEAVKKFQGTAEYKIFPRIGMSYYDFNCAKKPFDDARVRKAFALSINRAQIIKNIIQSTAKPAYGFVPYGIPDGVQTNKDYRAVVGDLIKEDPAEGRRLLADAGYPGGKGFPSVTLICQANQIAKDVAQALQAMWKTNLGVSVDIQSYETKAYWNELHQGNFDIGADSWTGYYPDPMANLDIFETDKSRMDTFWSNKEYDALLKTNLKIIDQRVRMANFAKAEKILVSEMPSMPIQYFQQALLCKPNVVGIGKSPFIIHNFFEFASVN